MRCFLGPSGAVAPGRRLGITVALTLAVASLQLAAPAAQARSDRQPGKSADGEERATQHPLTIVVSTGHQHVKVYNAANRIVADSPVSTGQPGHETPHGVFSIIAKERMHHSNLYDDAPMPWMERITWSGVALHAGNLPGYAASHGCIRLPHNFSRSLYAITRIGTRVIVARGDPSPRSFAHQGLFKPLPSAAALVALGSRPAGGATATAAQPTVEPAALLGISPANAGEVERAVRTREQAAAERAARIAQSKTRLETAETSRASLDAAAREAAGAAREALTALAEERAEAARIDDARRKLVADQADVRRELTGLSRLAHQAGSDDALDSGAAREQQLEDRLDALAVQISGADGAVSTQAELIAAAAGKADAAAARSATARAELKRAVDEVEAARTALDRQTREEANRDRPITVFISRKTSKLYVRQGFDELFEAPVSFTDANLPVGTHVFTALGETADGMGLNWSVVTVQSGEASENAKARKSRRKGDDAAVVDETTAARASTPDRVLDRIEVPADVRARIAEFIKPGSSLIVSDNAASHETGRGTDFVILTR